MSNVLQATQDYLKNAEHVKIAHLVELELPGESGVYLYTTDYFRDINYSGNTYSTSILKKVGSVKLSKRFMVPQLPIQVSGAIQSEVDRVLSSNSFLGRKIKVYRVYIDDDGEIIPFYKDGSTLTYFEGSITSSDIRDSLGTSGIGSATITWTCASKFTDFEAVNGRITDDESHRGLINVGGKLVPSSAAKHPEYQLDKGFMHANKSIKVLAEYQTKEKRYKLKTRKAGGFRGIMGQKHYDMVEYWADVVKEVDMDINLAAKYIPVIYGVQKTSGIPVFVDTQADKSNIVWAVYAICEGEIEGFLDIYFDDKPIICVSPDDTSQRACLGVKKERGDTIATTAVTPTLDNPMTVPGAPYSYDDGNGPIDFWVYHGSKTQAANPELVKVARDGNFKIQSEGGIGPEYWDEHFKLTDTAYIVVKIELNENRTNLPEIAAEVRGRKIAVYYPDNIVSADATSTNLAWQTLDYLTSDTFGAGIPLSSIDLPYLIDCANIMDVQDDSYQNDWVPYWRYLGWEDSFGSNRQLVQGSALLNTSSTVFKNVESLISQFDASLNIVSGKYTLTMESDSPSVADIDYGEMIKGSLSVKDRSLSEKFNSVQAAISDPANGWNTTTINFFNKDYKKEDNNKEKKANITFPYITNYYTARTRAEYFLKKSRYSKYIDFELPYKYIGLHPNSNITLTVPRYSWDKKKVLVEDVTNLPNGNIRVSAKEYADDVFINSPQLDNGANQDPTIILDVLPPTNLRFDPLESLPDDSDYRKVVGLNGIISWDQSNTRGIAYYAIQYTGKVDIDTIALDGSEKNNRIDYVVSNLDEGDYLFEIRAVTRTGNTSFPAKLNVKISANKILAVVPNFHVVNISDTFDNVFVGSGVQLAWDEVAGASKIPSLRYQLQALDFNDTILRSINIPYPATDFTYTREMNKQDYIATNKKLGIYRKLRFRIQAAGDAGTVSADWATI